MAKPKLFLRFWAIIFGALAALLFLAMPFVSLRGKALCAAAMMLVAATGVAAALAKIGTKRT